jgi:hypothetical protein
MVSALSGVNCYASDQKQKKKHLKRSTMRRKFPYPGQDRITEIEKFVTVEAFMAAPVASKREAWEALGKKYSRNVSGIIRRAEKEMNLPIPELTDELFLQFTKMGNRTNYQRPYGERTKRLNHFFLAECFEDKGRFLPAIEKYIDVICDEKTWVMPAHDKKLLNFKGRGISVDLGSVARAELLTAVYTTLGQKLSEKSRNKIKTEVRRRIINPYFLAVRPATSAKNYNWWTTTTNNWNAVCSAGVVYAALVFGDVAEKAEVLACMEMSNKYYLSGFTNDGYCSEGLAYWNYGFGNYLYMAELVKRGTVGKIDIVAGNKVKAIATFPQRLLIQKNIYPSFADCPVGAKPGADASVYSAMLGLTPLPKHFNTSRAAFAGSGASQLMLLFADYKKFKHQGEVILPPQDVFKQAQIYIFRAPKAEIPFGAAIKGGHNAEHHNHNDIGSYVIALGDKMPVTDAGAEVYTRRTFSARRYESKVINSWGHDVPVVAGQLQLSGRKYKGKVLKSEFTADKDTLLLDLKAAYELPELKVLQRDFVFDRKNLIIEVCDQVKFDSPKDFETAIITYDEFKVTGNKVLISAGKHKIEADISASVPFTVFSEKINEQMRRPPKPWRIGIKLKKPVQGGFIKITYKIVK